ncbi:hypothetical protein K9K77_03545 [Candidatus Babeliales bacterium]|nr:hypothetical protein [Candidatus Babeliales bacterium]
MEKRERALYIITIFSLMALGYIFFGAVTKIPNIANEKFMSLTGNVVFDLENNLKIGDALNGDIVINQGETDNGLYGMMLLTKDNNPITTKTFNLKEVLNKDENSGKKFIRIEEIIEYRFEESGNYELLFSVLDLNINLKRRIIVE